MTWAQATRAAHPASHIAFCKSLLGRLPSFISEGAVLAKLSTFLSFYKSLYKSLSVFISPVSSQPQRLTPFGAEDALSAAAGE